MLTLVFGRQSIRNQSIRKDQAAASTTLYQQRSGQPQRKRVRRERSRLQQQLQQLCKQYADGARDVQQQFLQ